MNKQNMQDLAKKIHDLSLALNKAREELRIIKRDILDSDSLIESSIAADTDLKNEQARNAKRLELKSLPNYSLTSQKADQVSAQIANLEADLALLKHEYQVEVICAWSTISSRFESQTMIQF